MTITFKVLGLHEAVSNQEPNHAYLLPSDWDDYSFKTSFNLIFCDSAGVSTELGLLKIGYPSQGIGWTLSEMESEFNYLPSGWFSLGQDVDYYKNTQGLSRMEDGQQILRALYDVAIDDSSFQAARDERVFKDSLLRGVSPSVIRGQYRRILAGHLPLTEFKFSYRDPGNERNAAISLKFNVDPESKPPTNLHVLIGRNGVGKTTLLNNMVKSIINPQLQENIGGKFYEVGSWGRESELGKEFFSSVVSASFSAFDPFLPPEDRVDRSKGVAYFYIGMKNSRHGDASGDKEKPPKTKAELVESFVESFKVCLQQTPKRKRWLSAIKHLESDDNFAIMGLSELLEFKEEKEALKSAREKARRMSSGHSIVLLTLTKLVETVEEKTLVLIDEPESHLHPPLLSAFLRAIADLLNNRNGLAIIATHSPVVVQEVPKSCVWKITRLRTTARVDRPERETFGENVGTLTSEIFGLEVTKSGFYELLRGEVSRQKSYETIVKEYANQLGVEAQAILLSLIEAKSDDEAQE